MQNPFYKDLLDDCQRSAMSMSCHKAELEDLSSKLAADVPQLAHLEQTLLKTPLWLENLRAAASKALTEKLVKACERYHNYHLALVKSCCDGTGEEMDAMLAPVRGFYEAMTKSKALVLKVPELAALLAAATSTMTLAQQKSRSIELSRVLEPFQGKDVATKVAQEALSAYLHREAVEDFPIDELAVQKMDNCAASLALLMADSVGCAHSEEEEARLTSAMSLLSKMQQLLKGKGAETCRVWLLSVLEPAFSLHKALVEERKADSSPDKQAIEQCFPRAIHFQSLAQRCREAYEVKPPKDSDDFVEIVLKSCETIVKEAEGEVQDMGKTMEKQALAALKASEAKSKDLFGSLEEIKERGSGKWSAKMKVTENPRLQDIVAFADKNLLTEASAKKTNDFLKSSEQAHPPMSVIMLESQP